MCVTMLGAVAVNGETALHRWASWPTVPAQGAVPKALRDSKLSTIEWWSRSILAGDI